MPFSHLFLLLQNELRRRPGQKATAIVAIALAASVLLTSFAGWHAAGDLGPLAGSSVLAPDQVHLRADDQAHPYLDEQLLQGLRADPRVRSVQTARRVRAIDLHGTEAGAMDVERFHDPVVSAGWGPQGRTSMWAWQGEPPSRLVDGRWPDPAGTDPIELVAPAYGVGEHKRPRHAIGDWRLLEGDTGPRRAVVVGVVDAGMWSSHSRELPGFLLSPAAAEELAGPAFAPSDARIELHDPQQCAGFVADWRQRLPQFRGRPLLWDRATLVQGHDRGFAVRAAESVARTALLLGAASVACIVLAILGSSVRERSAQYRLLRTIGATRRTVVTLVLLESLVFALGGLVGAWLLAWAALSGLSAWLPFLSVAGGMPDARSLLLTFVVVMLGVLAGAGWPAWLAASRRPVESPRHATGRHRWRTAGICALVAVGVAALATTVIALVGGDTPQRAALLAWVGIPAVALVAILLTPLALRVAGTVLLRPVAALTRSDALVLEDQVAGDESRSFASVLAIAVGLGGFLLMLCWGASMLDAFVLDGRLPRWLVSVHPHGLDRQETERVLAVDGLQDMLPLALVDTRLGDRMAAPGDTPADLSCLVAGLDPERGFGDGAAALPWRFVAGDAATAREQLAGGDACVISDWFANDYGLSVGDLLRCVVPGRHTVDGSGDACYRIAAIVDLRGWRMVFKHNKTRHRNFKQQALVVLDAEVVRRDFGTAHCNYLIGDGLEDRPYPVGLPLREAFAVCRVSRQKVEDAVVDAIDLGRRIDNRSDAVTAVVTTGRSVMVDDLDRTRHVLRTDWGGKAVQRLGWLPLLALILSLVPVAASQFAAMWARAREIGVLRSCGLGRFALLRLAVAEGLLVGVAAMLVALLFATGGAWLLLRVATIVGYHLRFAGIQPDFVIPWPWLVPGWALTVAVSVAAALLAGWRIGRRRPAALLTASVAARL